MRAKVSAEWKPRSGTERPFGRFMSPTYTTDEQRFNSMDERNVDVAIIGAGSAGLYALGQVRKANKEFVLINGGELGTTCARVGCMPSKALIQVAEDYHRRSVFERHGIAGGGALELSITDALDHVRDLRDTFVDRVLSNSTDQMGDELIDGYARFLEPTLLEVEGQRIRAKKVVLATGSRPFIPATWEPFRDRIITTDEVFELEELPTSAAVVGLGVIGLEIGQSLHRYGVQVTGIDQLSHIGGLVDPVVNEVAVDVIGKEFPLWLGHAAEIREQDGKLRVSSGDNRVLVDKVFASMGRVPNVEGLGLEGIGAPLDARGVPVFDRNTMQIGDLPIFIAGDVNGERLILHEAGDEGRIAGYNASRDQVTAFRRKTPLAITFCDPQIATVGQPLAELDEASTAIGEIRFAPVGRALIMAKNKGILRVYADKGSGRLLGAAMACPKGENLAHLLAWCIQQGLTVFDLIKMPFYHPVIEEALQAALYNLVTQVEVKPDAIPELTPL